MALGHGDLQGLANQDDSTFLNMRSGGTTTEEGRIVIVQVRARARAVCVFFLNLHRPRKPVVTNERTAGRQPPAEKKKKRTTSQRILQCRQAPFALTGVPQEKSDNC